MATDARSYSQPSDMHAPQLVCVIGRAGAGHSTALKILEDAGFTAVDNMPLALVDQLVSMIVETEERPLAIGIDIRTSGFDHEAMRRLADNLRRRFSEKCQIVCVTASDEELIKRYKATRRRHPLMDGQVDLEQAVRRDSQRLQNMEALADIVIDSTGQAPHEFGAELRTRLSIPFSNSPPLSIVSFSYRAGLPASADMIFDMRFIRNPHWKDSLRALTGTDDKVSTFVESDPAFSPFMSDVVSQLKAVMPLLMAQGRHQLTIGFGCTGGKHRSVASACWLARWAEQQNIPCHLSHRELS